MIGRILAWGLAVGVAVAVAAGGTTALAEIGAGLAWGLGVGVGAAGIGAGVLFAFLGLTALVDRQLARRNELMRWRWELELAARHPSAPLVQYRWQPGRILPAPPEETYNVD